MQTAAEMRNIALGQFTFNLKYVGRIQSGYNYYLAGGYNMIMPEDLESGAMIRLVTPLATIQEISYALTKENAGDSSPTIAPSFDYYVIADSALTSNAKATLVKQQIIQLATVPYLPLDQCFDGMWLQIAYTIEPVGMTVTTYTQI